MTVTAHHGGLRTFMMTRVVHGLSVHVRAMTGTAHLRAMILLRAWRAKARASFLTVIFNTAL